jgi:hypothetical protein
LTNIKFTPRGDLDYTEQEKPEEDLLLYSDAPVVLKRKIKKQILNQKTQEMINLLTPTTNTNLKDLSVENRSSIVSLIKAEEDLIEFHSINRSPIYKAPSFNPSQSYTFNKYFHSWMANLTPALPLFSHIKNSCLELWEYSLPVAAVSALVEALQDSSIDIEAVSLASNSMSDEGMAVLLEGLRDRQVKRVMYHKNEMGRKAVQVMEEMMEGFEEIQFSHLKIDWMTLNSFLEAVLEKGMKLKVLGLCKSVNLCLGSLKFNLKTVQLLWNLIKKSNLLKLDISWNNMLQNQLSKILLSINKSTKLTDLNISWNNMSWNNEKFEDHFISWIQTGKRIKHLDLSYTNITLNFGQKLIESLNTWRSLQCLHLSGNKDLFPSLPYLKSLLKITSPTTQTSIFYSSLTPASPSITAPYPKDLFQKLSLRIASKTPSAFIHKTSSISSPHSQLLFSRVSLYKEITHLAEWREVGEWYLCERWKYAVVRFEEALFEDDQIETTTTSQERLHLFEKAQGVTEGMAEGVYVWGTVTDWTLQRMIRFDELLNLLQIQKYEHAEEIKHTSSQVKPKNFLRRHGEDVEGYNILSMYARHKITHFPSINNR